MRPKEDVMRYRGSGVEIMTYTIKNGDTLSGLALRFLGDARLWPRLWQANAEVLEREQKKIARRNVRMTGPNWIFPGTEIVIPTK